MPGSGRNIFSRIALGFAGWLSARWVDEPAASKSSHPVTSEAPARVMPALVDAVPKLVAAAPVLIAAAAPIPQVMTALADTTVEPQSALIKSVEKPSILAVEPVVLDARSEPPSINEQPVDASAASSVEEAPVLVEAPASEPDTASGTLLSDAEVPHTEAENIIATDEASVDIIAALDIPSSEADELADAAGDSDSLQSPIMAEAVAEELSENLDEELADTGPVLGEAAVLTTEVEATGVQVDDAVMIAAEDFETASDAASEMAVAPNFMFAARLAAVAKLNAPASRAARRGDRVAPAGRAIPMPRGLEIKSVKSERLPTATARPRPPRKSHPSAEIIDITTARPRLRTTTHRRAA